jgi:hypothetical protein
MPTNKLEHIRTMWTVGSHITTYRILTSSFHSSNTPSPLPLHSHGHVSVQEHHDTLQSIESNHGPSPPRLTPDASGLVLTSCEWGCDKLGDWDYWLSEGTMTRPDVGWHKLSHRQNTVGRFLVAPRAMEVLGSADSSRLRRMPRYPPTSRHKLPSPAKDRFKDIL